MYVEAFVPSQVYGIILKLQVPAPRPETAADAVGSEGKAMLDVANMAPVVKMLAAVGARPLGRAATAGAVAPET